MKHAQEPPNWREHHAAQRDKGIRKRTFTVVGETKVAGKSAGETVELEFPEDAIDALIQAGCIQETGVTVPVLLPVADLAAFEASVGEEPAEPRATRARNNKKG